MKSITFRTLKYGTIKSLSKHNNYTCILLLYAYEGVLEIPPKESGSLLGGQK
jgi:hypothetical protein